MSLAPFLILPLVGGYAFAATWSYTRFLVARETGHRLYFRSVFYAVLSLAVGATLHLLATIYWGWYGNLLDFIAQLLGYPRDPALLADRPAKALILVGTVFIGPILGHLLNLPNVANRESRFARCLPRWLQSRFERWNRNLLLDVIQNNDFEKLLLSSAETQRAVLFTLQSGKVYAGWVVRAPNPVEQRRAIRILPVFSGYREEHTHRLQFTTSYADVLSSLAEDGNLEHLSLEDFEVIIPSDQVAYAHLFDSLAYRRFSGVVDPQPPLD